MKQNPNDFVLFEEPYTIKRKMPCYVNMQKETKRWPTNYALEGGPDGIRDWYNAKNLRKRKT